MANIPADSQAIHGARTKAEPYRVLSQRGIQTEDTKAIEPSAISSQPCMKLKVNCEQ
jgi:hypothetical protein